MSQSTNSITNMNEDLTSYPYFCSKSSKVIFIRTFKAKNCWCGFMDELVDEIIRSIIQVIRVVEMMDGSLMDPNLIGLKSSFLTIIKNYSLIKLWIF